jgi:hypothetical protein
MSRILTEAITGPSAWKGCDIAGEGAWSRDLSPRDIDELDAALVRFRARNRTGVPMAREDFPLPGWEETLSRLAAELEDGRGFFLMRGLPVDRYGEEDIRAIYYGIGLNLGIPVRQNPRGDLLGAVENVADASDPHSRVYETNAYLPYHTDPSDVVGLLCLRKARKGGLSSLVSVPAVYNEMLLRCPEYLGLFYRPWYYAHLGEDLPSLSPLFSHHRGKLAFRYLRQYIELGHEIMERPLSAVEVEALDAFDAIAREDGMQLDMMLEPGDLQWANNYTVLHSRTGFEDDPDPSRRRKMLRLWLKMPNARDLAPDFPGRNGFPAMDDKGLDEGRAE